MLKWVEGFDYLANGTTAASLEGALKAKYVNVDTTAATDASIEGGRGGGQSLAWGSGTAQQIITPNLGNQATWVVSFAMRTPATFDTDRFLEIRDNFSVQMALQVNGSDELQVTRNTTVLATDTGNALSASTWYWVEFKVTINNSSGSYELKLNESTVLSGTSVDTQNSSNASANRVRFSRGLGTGWRLDDLFIMDGTGSNNDFKGNSKVVVIKPNADTASEDWATSAGTSSYELVDEEGPFNGDTDYIESGTQDEQTLFDYGSVGILSGDIHGLQINTECKNTGTDFKTLKTVAKSGATTSPDSGQHVGNDDYRTLVSVSEQNPNTSSAWTKTSIDAAQFGVKVG